MVLFIRKKTINRYFPKYTIVNHRRTHYFSFKYTYHKYKTYNSTNSNTTEQVLSIETGIGVIAIFINDFEITQYSTIP